MSIRKPPQPGTRVRGSHTGKPVMALLDLIGRRWVLRILWELYQNPLGFRALQGKCGNLSPTILSQRLKDLRGTALVEVDEQGDYRMTSMGADLVRTLLPLHAWAESWAKVLMREGSAGPSDSRR